jgi:hypothetical protein
VWVLLCIIRVGGGAVLHITLLDAYFRLIDHDYPIIVSRNVSGNDIGSLVELRPRVLARKSVKIICSLCFPSVPSTLRGRFTLITFRFTYVRAGSRSVPVF